MSVTDPLSDLLTRIRNGQRTSKTVVESPSSKLRVNVLDALKREGYIRGYSVEELQGKIDQSRVRIELKYYEGEPVIREIHRVSKPGRRVYSKIKDLSPVYNGLGITILSTPKGILSDAEARRQNVGGEILCTVF